MVFDGAFSLRYHAIFYSDGSRVSDLMSAYLSTLWATGYPNPNGNYCVAFKYLKLVNVPCDSSTPFYYDKANDTNPSTTTKPLLGYLCETRIMTDVTGTDSCYFPFQYVGKTYYSCSLDNNTLLNNNGAPWCASDVSYNLKKFHYLTTSLHFKLSCSFTIFTCIDN